MCCLKYEQDAYEDLLKRSPKAESFVDTPDGRGTVIEVDLLRQRVKVRMEDSESTGVYKNEDIAVLRNGKAKKTDPPIPADLAPISGGKARKKQPDENTPVMLDSIRMRYSTETIAEEQVIVEEQPEQPEAPKQGRNRNRRRRNGNKSGEAKSAQESGEKPKQQKKQQPAAPKETPAEAKEQKEPKEPAVEGAKKRRRPHYRRRPKGNKE